MKDKDLRIDRFHHLTLCLLNFPPLSLSPLLRLSLPLPPPLLSEHLCVVFPSQFLSQSRSHSTAPRLCTHPYPSCLHFFHFLFFPPSHLRLFRHTSPHSLFSLCSHCSVSNGSAPSQQNHHAEARRAAAPTNSSQPLALSRLTANET